MLGSGEGTSSAQAGWTLGMGLDLKGGLIRKGVPSCGGRWSLPCLGFKENVYYLLFGDILSKQLVLGG